MTGIVHVSVPTESVQFVPTTSAVVCGLGVTQAGGVAPLTRFTVTVICDVDGETNFGERCKFAVVVPGAAKRIVNCAVFVPLVVSAPSGGAAVGGATVPGEPEEPPPPHPASEMAAR